MRKLRSRHELCIRQDNKGIKGKEKYTQKQLAHLLQISDKPYQNGRRIEVSRTLALLLD